MTAGIKKETKAGKKYAPAVPFRGLGEGRPCLYVPVTIPNCFHSKRSNVPALRGLSRDPPCPDRSGVAGPSSACFLLSFSLTTSPSPSPASQLCPFLSEALGLPLPSRQWLLFCWCLSWSFVPPCDSLAEQSLEKPKMLSQGTEVRGHQVRWTALSFMGSCGGSRSGMLVVSGAASED